MDAALIVFIVFASITVWRWFYLQEQLARTRQADSSLTDRVSRLESTVEQLRDMVADAVISGHDAEQARRLGEAIDASTAVDAR